MSARIISPIIAVTVGIISGVYVFKPLLESYEESTGGTFLPEKDDHSAPVPPLPMTSLLPNTGLPKEPIILPTTPPTEGKKEV